MLRGVMSNILVPPRKDAIGWLDYSKEGNGEPFGFTQNCKR